MIGMHHPSRRTRKLQSIFSGALILLLVGMIAGAAVVGRSPHSALAQSNTLSTASVTPDSTLLYFVTNLDLTSPQATKTTELLNRLGVDSSLENLFSDVGSSATGGTTIAAADIVSLLGGTAAFAVFTIGSDLTGLSSSFAGLGLSDLGTATPEATLPATSSFALILSAPNPETAYASLEKTLNQDATDQGATVAETTYEGVTIKSIPADESTGSSGESLARVGDFVVVGAVPADIEPVVDTQSGKTPALADDENFKKVSAELNSEWLVFGNVNGAVAAEQLKSVGTSAGLNESSVDMTQLEANTGFVVWADDLGFRADTISIPTGDSPPTMPENYVANLPSKVPADSAVFADGYDLGKSGALDTLLLSVLGGLAGSFGDAVATPDPSKTAEELANEQFAQLESILGFNIKTDYIDQLVGEWGFSIWGLKLDDSEAMDPSKLGFILVSDVKDPATLAVSISKLSLLIQAGLSGQGNVTTKKIGDSSVCEVTIESTTGSAPTTIQYGVVGNQYVIGINEAISTYVAGTVDSLANNANFKAVFSSLPAEHSGIFYLDLKQLIPLYEAQAAATAAASSDFKDASETCATYSTQAAAQEAFDADQSTNWELDQDFDGQACEDYFTAAATPEAESSPTASQYAAIESFGSVSFVRDGFSGTSSILLIAK